VDYREGYARFSVRVRDHELVVSSNIPYKRGMMGYIISLGALVPPFTGGLIGGRIDGTEDWRYCKDLGTRAVRNLVYWDGLGWRPVPKDFKDGLGTKLSGIGVWKEGETVKTQYGTLPWPDEVPDWNPYSLTQLERALARWTVSIAEHWTSTFDIKRDQCHGHDPRCCRYPVKFDVDFFEVDKKVKAGIVIGENYVRANDSAWPLESSGLTAAHEFGHHLGNPDEYPGAATVDVFVNGDGARFGIDKASIMGEGPVIRRRHFDTIVKVLTQLVERETGKSYTYSTVPAIKK
jgi:hypothetical protein